jgi:hypothetical protein
MTAVHSGHRGPWFKTYAIPRISAKGPEARWNKATAIAGTPAFPSCVSVPLGAPNPRNGTVPPREAHLM